MNWLERYVAEVERYLPRSSRRDIRDELHSLLEDKLDARSEALSRPLSENDVLRLLQETGHPLQVAAAYNAGRSLISAQLFPFYIIVIRNLILAASAVYLLSIIWASFMSEHIAWSGFSFGDLWNFTVNWLVFITAGFYLAERYLLTRDFFASWDPRGLPPGNTPREGLATSISACIAIAIWLLLLNVVSNNYSLALIIGQAANPVPTFAFWLKVQAVIVMGVYLLLLFKPYWTKGKRIAIMLSDVAVVLGASLALAGASRIDVTWSAETAPPTVSRSAPTSGATVPSAS